MRRRRVNMEEPSRVPIREGCRMLLEPRQTMMKVKRSMRRREEGWLAGRRRLRMPTKVRKAEGSKYFWM